MVIRNLRALPAHSAQKVRSRSTSCAQILPVDHLAIVLLGIYGLSPYAPSGESILRQTTTAQDQEYVDSCPAARLAMCLVLTAFHRMPQAASHN